jgi:hypothetical protein
MSLGFLFSPHTAIALFPVILFLAFLIYCDSFKLVPLRLILTLVGVGATMTAAGYVSNNFAYLHFPGDFTAFSRYGSPFIEEALKASPLVFLIRTKRVGILVDAAIAGRTDNTGQACNAAKRIVVIGGHADLGVLSGAGSSQVAPREGPSVTDVMGGEGALSFIRRAMYMPSSPLKAIRAGAPQAKVTFDDGRYPAAAADLAKNADVAIVFATQWMMEAYDSPDLSLPSGQDELIAAVAAANPNTIVVLETGGPVTMPWLDQVGAVVEACIRAFGAVKPSLIFCWARWPRRAACRSPSQPRWPRRPIRSCRGSMSLRASSLMSTMLRAQMSAIAGLPRRRPSPCLPLAMD